MGPPLTHVSSFVKRLNLAETWFPFFQVWSIVCSLKLGHYNVSSQRQIVQSWFCFSTRCDNDDSSFCGSDVQKLDNH